MKYRCLILDHDDTSVQSTPEIHYLAAGAAHLPELVFGWDMDETKKEAPPIPGRTDTVSLRIIQGGGPDR
ncbi:MAG: hypothetical protein B6241_00370 [Spirochaetaceae bacterium 4572_59]|nr:MAG: hypothetical protein B6241_00370 [Spirochaetaceae bacterium 4572_59]